LTLNFPLVMVRRQSRLTAWRVLTLRARKPRAFDLP
jgi:hypothetical protein